MVELEFHCCVCGEENIKKEFINTEYNYDDIISTCDYCKVSLNLRVQIKPIVISVDEQ